MANGWCIIGIAAEQRGVGSVQRGDHAWLFFFRQHGAGKNGRRRVGHCIVHMEDVQMMVAADLSHSNRQGQGVVRIFEQAVIVHPYGMKVKPGSILRQAKRSFVTDEMDLVSPLSQLFPKLRRQDSAAANRRIAGYSNVHIPPSLQEFSSTTDRNVPSVSFCSKLAWSVSIKVYSACANRFVRPSTSV